MGSPISPVLACLFMEFFEKDLIPKVTQARKYIMKRYVDDTVVVWNNEEDFNMFFSQINNIHKNIKFTVEEEKNNRLPFLDLELHRREEGILTSIYRKPMYTNIHTHFFSCHSMNVKKETVAGFFRRALLYCNEEFVSQELEFIKQTFRNLGYPDNLIEDIYHKTKRKMYPKKVTKKELKEEKKQRVIIPYMDGLGDLKEIIPKNVQLCYRSSNSLRTSLVKTGGIRKENEVRGLVYGIPCADCDKWYIGETGNTLKKRIRDHRYAIKTGNESNAIFKHIKEMGHLIEIGKAVKIKTVKNYGVRRTTEAAIIQNTDNINIQVKTPLNIAFYNNLVFKTLNNEIVNKLKNC